MNKFYNYIREGGNNLLNFEIYNIAQNESFVESEMGINARASYMPCLNVFVDNILYCFYIKMA